MRDNVTVSARPGAVVGLPNDIASRQRLRSVDRLTAIYSRHSHVLTALPAQQSARLADRFLLYVAGPRSGTSCRTISDRLITGLTGSFRSLLKIFLFARYWAYSTLEVGLHCDDAF